jgi:Cu2+-exporting ATPase
MNSVRAIKPLSLEEPSQCNARAIATCFHCGLAVPNGTHWHAEIEGVMQPMCCPGCQAVAESIVASGFSDYYRTRLEFAATADAPTLVPMELTLYDAQLDAKATASGSPSTTCEAMFSVEGIRCAACVWLIERRLARLSGVTRAEMNVATSQLDVNWDSERCKPSDIIKALRTIGYAAYPYDSAKHGEQLERARKTLFRRLFIAGLSMMQVMMYAVPAYIAKAGSMDASMHELMCWAGLLLTLPAVLYSAQPFYVGTWFNLKNRMLGMDVPVALGISAAFVGSTVATLRGQGDVYFDSITMFIFLLLCSRYLELGARRKAASALDSLHHALPASALRMGDFPASRETEMLAATELQCGDVVLVRAGDAIAADGVILEGHSTVDQSLLTGESRAQAVSIGSKVPGGAVNQAHPFVMKVTRQPDDSTLSVLMRLVEKASLGKPQIAQWADKVASWFVVSLLLFAIAVFGYWQWTDADRAWQIAIAVLVVSCPCALSLATPTVLAAATNRLLRQGVLIVKPTVLETLHRATHTVFDKTGTLTMGKPCLQRIQVNGEMSSSQCLAIAGALGAGSLHPLSIALCSAARDSGVGPYYAQDILQFTGQGLEGEVSGCRYRLGNAAFTFNGSQFPDVATEVSDVTSVYLGSRDKCIARFDLTDGLRPEAKAVVDHFHAQGKTVVLLSGDHPDIALRVARQLGIAESAGNCMPDQKLQYVQALQQQGAVVAMVGDGINDAAVLSAADVSIAMGGGAPLAQMHADCVLLSGKLAALSLLSDTARKSISIMRQNLAWATLYNLLAIPAAATGVLNPWMSGVGMSLSSAIVVLNALRLQRKSPQQGLHPDGEQPIPNSVSIRAG